MIRKGQHVILWIYPHCFQALTIEKAKVYSNTLKVLMYRDIVILLTLYIDTPVPCITPSPICMEKNHVPLN